MAYLFTMELGEAALDVNLLAVELLACAGAGGAGVVMVEVRAGRTGTEGSTVG